MHIITSTAVNLELTGQYPLSVFHSKQIRVVSVNQFHLLLWAYIYGSPYDYVIDVALIAIPRTSLITSSQPPLEGYILFIFDR